MRIISELLFTGVCAVCECVCVLADMLLVDHMYVCISKSRSPRFAIIYMVGGGDTVSGHVCLHFSFCTSFEIQENNNECV